MLAFVAVIINAYYQKQQFEQRNQPVWTTSQILDRVMVDAARGYAIENKNNDLVFMRRQAPEIQLLFSNYRDEFESIKLYLKDLDQNGLNEIIFLVADGSYGDDVYVFFNLDEDKLGLYRGKDLVWTADKLLFNNSGDLYVRSCGSQYCNDTFYTWSNGELVEGHTDTYESM